MCCGRKFIAGSKGIAKAVLHLEQCPSEIIETRRTICRACEFAVPCPFIKTRFCVCSKCRCLLKAKITLKNEECPIGKWKKYESQELPKTSSPSVSRHSWDAFLKELIMLKVISGCTAVIEAAPPAGVSLTLKPDMQTLQQLGIMIKQMEATKWLSLNMVGKNKRKIIEIRTFLINIVSTVSKHS